MNLMAVVKLVRRRDIILSRKDTPADTIIQVAPLVIVGDHGETNTQIPAIDQITMKLLDGHPPEPIHTPAAIQVKMAAMDKKIIIPSPPDISSPSIPRQAGTV